AHVGNCVVAGDAIEAVGTCGTAIKNVVQPPPTTTTTLPACPPPAAPLLDCFACCDKRTLAFRACNPEAPELFGTATGEVVGDACVGGAIPGTGCSSDADCEGGVCDHASHLLDLALGGLYFGGGASSVPLPITVPDMSNVLTDITSCDRTTGEFHLGPRTA